MSSNKPDVKALCLWCVLAVLAVAVVLVVAFAFVVPVLVTVDEATLGRLAIAAPAAGNNGTAAAATSLISYDLALVITVHNHNWAMHVRRTAPLDAELRFGVLTFHRVRLVGPEDWDKIPPLTKVVQSFTEAAERKPVALGRHGAAEFARQSASGVFQLELVVTGQFKYQTHSHRRGLQVSCPLRLALSMATAPAAFEGVACT